MDAAGFVNKTVTSKIDPQCIWKKNLGNGLGK